MINGRRIGRIVLSGAVAAASASLVVLAPGPVASAAPLGTVVGTVAGAVSAPVTPPVGGVRLSPVRVSAAARARAAGVATTLPVSVSLRDRMPAILSQGQVGDCVDWTTAYYMMGYYAARDQVQGAPYAPLYLYLKMLGDNPTWGSAPSSGTYVTPTLSALRDVGVDTQSDFLKADGTPNYYDYTRIPTSAQVSNSANFKIKGWASLFSGGVQGSSTKTVIQQALAKGDPVALIYPIYTDYWYGRPYNGMNWDGKSVYDTPPAGTTNIGYHASVLEGYDANGVWVRNSWGTGWANGGEAQLSWNFIANNAAEAYTISGVSYGGHGKIVAQPPTVSSISTAGNLFVTGNVAATVTGTGLDGVTAMSLDRTRVPFTKSSATSLRVTLPAHAPGTAILTVTAQSGSATGTVTYVVRPSVTSAVSPTAYTQGGALLTVNGVGLDAVTAVTVDATPASYTASPNRLVVTLPPHATGTVPVRLTTPYGAFLVQVRYVPSTTTIGQVVPKGSFLFTTGGSVTVTGTGLSRVSAVAVDGIKVAFTISGDSAITFAAPTHSAGSARLTLTTSGDPVISSLTYVQKSAITSVAATVAPVTTQGGTLVLTGVALDRVTSVTVAGVKATFNSTATAVTVTLPTSRTAGSKPVVLVTPYGSLTTSVNYRAAR